MRATSLVLSLLLVSPVVLAQGQGNGQRPGASGGTDRGPGTVSSHQQEDWAHTKGFINNRVTKDMADDMAFKPGFNKTTLGEVLGHMVDTRYGFCAAARGIANPNTVNFQKTIKTKADALKAIAESEAFCDPAFASLTDASFMEVVTPISPIEGGGTNPMPRGSILAELLLHDSIMYGYAVVYVRTVVQEAPPAPAQSGGAGQQGGGAPPTGRGN